MASAEGGTSSFLVFYVRVRVRACVRAAAVVEVVSLAVNRVARENVVICPSDDKPFREMGRWMSSSLRCGPLRI